MENEIGKLQAIIRNRNYQGLVPLAEALNRKLKDKYLEVAIVGQFKCGKSSLVNHLLQTDILPTGVTPVTAVVARIQYGEAPRCLICTEDGQTREIDLNELPLYIVEEYNPGNAKKVILADVWLPQMQHLEPLRLVDTPGLGSIFAHNSEATRQWLVNLSAALITVSAERPLAADDLTLISEIRRYAPRTAIVITKKDLFEPPQLEKIGSYITQTLEASFKEKPQLYFYSVKNGETERDQLIQHFFQPLMNEFTQVSEEVIRHKLNTLAAECEGLLSLSLRAAQNTEAENLQLRDLIIEGQTRLDNITHELSLITQDLQRKSLHFTEGILLPHLPRLIAEINADFGQAYPTVKKNLYQTSRWFEQWLSNELRDKIREIINQQMPELERFHEDMRQRYTFFFEAITSKLKAKVEQHTGIRLPERGFALEIPGDLKPDISISYTFDTQIDLLWFLIPMRWFRSYFRKIFLSRAEQECEKNLRRQASDLADILNNLSREYSQITLKELENEIATIENILLERKPDIEGLLQDAEIVRSVRHKLGNQLTHP